MTTSILFALFIFFIGVALFGIALGKATSRKPLPKEKHDI